MIAAVLLVGVTGLLLTLLVSDRPKPDAPAVNQPADDKLPPLSGATGWINSTLLTRADLKGKVVVVEFWTYTCINSRRTFPYVRQWADKYRDQGLVVIGVHTPEFSFEKETANVQRAVKEQDIRFPVALDNNYGVWFAFRNEYWPALYFIDAESRIRHHQFGEGSYEQSERVIQQMLTESGANGVNIQLVVASDTGVEKSADWQNLQSPETYLGYSRIQNFSSPGGPVTDKQHVYTTPSKLRLNQWALAGVWTMGHEADRSGSGDCRLIFRFHARDLNLIMGPATPGTSIRFKVRVDGKVPDEMHGFDIDAAGDGAVNEQRMYQLIRQTGVITDRVIEVVFQGPGVDVFDVTFG